MIAGREDGACIDRVCVSSYSVAPTELGDEDDVVDAVKAVRTDEDAIHSLRVSSDGHVVIDYVSASANQPLRISLYHPNGVEVASASAVITHAGQGSLSFPTSLPRGLYVCRLLIGHLSVARTIAVR